jgi:hypothetical protein
MGSLAVNQLAEFPHPELELAFTQGNTAEFASCRLAQVRKDNGNGLDTAKVDTVITLGITKRRLQRMYRLQYYNMLAIQQAQLKPYIAYTSTPIKTFFLATQKLGNGIQYLSNSLKRRKNMLDTR